MTFPAQRTCMALPHRPVPGFRAVGPGAVVRGRDPDSGGEREDYLIIYPTWYPTWMKKTSVYLDDADVERLRRIAAEEGRSQAEVVRAALSAYEQARAVPRVFALEGSWQGDGSSVADVPEEELLAGFGG